MKMLFRLPRPSGEPVVNRTCPICGCTGMHIHQHQRERGIVDWRLDTIPQVRVKCPSCGKTATCRPAGIAAGRHRTQAVSAFGIVLYTLGLSYGSAGSAIRSLAGAGSKSTVHRDVIAAGGKARRMHTVRAGRAVRVLGIDGTGQKIKRTGKGKRAKGSVGVAFAVDAEHQTLLAVELVEEENERQVRRFVKRLCRDYGVECIITDEHTSYAKAMQARTITAQHRLCETHWKKSKQNRIRSLQSQAEDRGYTRFVRDLKELRRLVRDGPDDAVERVQKIHLRYLDYASAPRGGHWTLGYHMRMLTLHLLDTWNRIGAETQPTNNTAERMIGLLLKIRSKTMRGFVKPDNILRFVHLAAHLWEGRGECELKDVC